MVREPEDIEVLELDFDEDNIPHLAGHAVTVADVFAVLDNAPRYFRNLPGRGASHVMIGPDAEGRYFYIPLTQTATAGRWRPITGWPMNRRRAERLYDKEGD